MSREFLMMTAKEASPINGNVRKIEGSPPEAG